MDINSVKNKQQALYIRWDIQCLLFYVYQIIKIFHCVNSNQTITTATESEQNIPLYISL